MANGGTKLAYAALSAHRSNPTPLACFCAFAIGAASSLQVANYLATGLSLICLLLVPAFFMAEHRGADLVPLLLAVLGAISALASSITNHVNVISWPNTLWHAAFALYFLGLAVLTGRSVPLIAMVVGGLGVGSVVYFVTKGIELTHTGSFFDLWKYGIAHGATILLVVAMTLRRVRAPWQATLLVVLGLGSLVLNFRSHALVCLTAAAILLAKRWSGDRVPRGWQFLGIAVFGITLAYLVPRAGRAGLFGPVLQTKTLEQDTTHLPTLLAGRTEPPMSLTAIAERPWLGWGSAMKLPPDVYNKAEHLAVQWGYAPTFPFEGYWRLPANDYSAMHSIILGSWAEGGVLAVLLPLWLLFAAMAIIWDHGRFGVWGPLVLIVALQAIWDLLYAPWTYNMVPECVCLALLFLATHFKPIPADP
ncbi:hypothetical protein M2432_000024 [Mycobacterium sp. OTB74]|nr:hypothetical protein [Mycobacterium sp. OTB74]